MMMMLENRNVVRTLGVWATAMLLAFGCAEQAPDNAETGTRAERPTDGSPSGAGGGRGAGAAGTAEAAEAAGSGVGPNAVDREKHEWPSGRHPKADIAINGVGTIEVELFPELAPKTVANFIELAESGFYDGTTFHRVIPDFMIQGGDPNSKDKNPRNDGDGGPGYRIPDEINGAPHIRGVLSMANTGKADSGGSQFFIMLGEAPILDEKHTVFGRVVEGDDVLARIAAVETDRVGRWGPKDRPIDNVVVEQITVERPAEIEMTE